MRIIVAFDGNEKFLLVEELRKAIHDLFDFEGHMYKRGLLGRKPYPLKSEIKEIYSNVYQEVNFFGVYYINVFLKSKMRRVKLEVSKEEPNKLIFNFYGPEELRDLMEYLASKLYPVILPESHLISEIKIWKERNPALYETWLNIYNHYRSRI
jgi:hypothetical protein